MRGFRGVLSSCWQLLGGSGMEWEYWKKEEMLEGWWGWERLVGMGAGGELG